MEENEKNIFFKLDNRINHTFKEIFKKYLKCRIWITLFRILPKSEILHIILIDISCIFKIFEGLEHIGIYFYSFSRNMKQIK